MTESTGEERDFPKQAMAGMQVVGRDGNHIGKVKVVRPGDFLLERPYSREIFVPFEHVESLSRADNRITLRISEGEIAEMTWKSLADDNVEEPFKPGSRG